MPVFIALTLILWLSTAGIAYQLGGTTSIVLTATGLWLLISIFVWRGLARHPHRHFGPANTVTSLRAMVSAIFAGLVPVADLLQGNGSLEWMWVITPLAIAVLLLDGLDGYLARRTGLASDFGARFDMETDALLALVLSVFLWQSGKLGAWILLLGVMRYVFIITSLMFTALQAELFPSIRRKAVCVIQLSALCALLCPWLDGIAAISVAVLTTMVVAWSFTVDTVWLLREGQKRRTEDSYAETF